MSHSTEQLRQHAEKHHDSHQELKRMLKNLPPPEKIWPLFAGTFVVTLIAIGAYFSWGTLTSFFTPPPPPAIPGLHGYQTGIYGTYKIDRQANDVHQRYLNTVATQASVKGALTTNLIAYAEPKPINTTLNTKSALATRALAYYKVVPKPYIGENLMKTSVWMTNYLGHGDAFTPLRNTNNLQKSVMATYYLGEKTEGVKSDLELDTELLQNIKNTLSVDLFDYLNQSANRADTLDSYLKLLNTLDQKARERIGSLNNKIAFLQGNATGLNSTISVSEKAFFDNLTELSGPRAQENLENFIGLRKDESEVRAKLGAYKKLQSYYQFFQPRIQNLIKEIQVNREPLIAGVKVIEIQNMSLPLIIRQK